jgi:hypothetical protein
MRTSVRLVMAAAVAAMMLGAAGTADAAVTTRAQWNMESTASMVDSSGNGNTGTPTAISAAPGSPGQGYRFNGSTSSVRVPSSSSLNPGSAAVTITAKLRFTSVPSSAVGDYDVVRKGLAASSGGEYKMEILPNATHTAGNAFCLFKDTSGRVGSIRDTRNLADGAWHTVSCARSATAVKVVVDGVTKTKAATLGPISNTAVLTVGAKIGGGDFYRGDMDGVGVTAG